MAKKPWQSKTVWVNLISAIVPFVPGLDAYIQSHQLFYPIAMAAINVLLRLITKSQISLGE